MPEPKKGESKDDFIKRCIMYVRAEESGKDVKPGYFYAKCNGIWETHRGGEK